MRSMYVMNRTLQCRWNLALVIVGLCMVPFALGTSPLPAPYHRYVVTGTLLHQDGSPAPDVIVVLFARTSRDTMLQIPHLDGRTDERPIAVTYPGGGYSVTVDVFMAADSLALGFIPPGRAMVMMPAFHPDPSLEYEVMSTSISNVETGCSGCGTEQSRYEYVSSYGTNLSEHYVLPD
jgi:hypothetical protein